MMIDFAELRKEKRRADHGNADWVNVEANDFAAGPRGGGKLPAGRSQLSPQLAAAPEIFGSLCSPAGAVEN